MLSREGKTTTADEREFNDGNALWWAEIGSGKNLEASRTSHPRNSEPQHLGTFFDERSKTGKLVDLSHSILKILINVHPKLACCTHKRLKSIPSLDAISGACLQAHVPFAYPLPRS